MLERISLSYITFCRGGGIILLIFCLSLSSFAQDENNTLSSDSTAQIHFEGDSISIASITLNGNNITKNHIILRELSFKKGDEISTEDLNEFLKKERNKVFNTNLFESVEFDYKLNERNELELTVDMVERWYIWPIPILEIADRNFNEWINNRGADFSRIYYGIQFKQRNFRGRNENLQLLLRGGFAELYRISYDAPYINKKQKTSLHIDAFYREDPNVAYKVEDDRFVEINSTEGPIKWTWGASVGIGRRAKFFDYHRLVLSYRNITVADTVTTLNPNYLADGKNQIQYLSLTYRYRRDMRNIASYPLSGSFLEVSLTKEGLGVFNDINTASFDLDYSKYFDLGNNFYHASGISAKVSTPNDLPYENSKTLGYSNNMVRGYDKYVSLGNSIGVLKNTLKYKLISTKININLDKKKFKYFSSIPIDIYIKTYADVGYSSQNDSFNSSELNELPNTFLGGGGLGLDIVTFYSTVLRLEYSENVHEKKGGFFFYLSADI
ncbi:BamA/TamA family outer membrane protein [Sediminitomix flava]|uniref:Surface antigen-like variable number repeat protein n=1 Tax=Sediminitomix flava TaxID=379075 RepID=A0A315ZJS7_SEDFL|nr:BamA/TamA family outer membrane protein [Sediminitomix flava]PWJ34161.1 surface antigen-like variable number repeat protein [Sediminitomix flava]